MAVITIPRALEMLNGINYTVQPFLPKWRDIYYRTSIHTTGTCPRFLPLRHDAAFEANGTGYIYPSAWLHERYDWIFDTHLLNRHPREPEVTRNWRKSVYRPYQMAPMLETITSLSACIFGDSKYTLEVENKEDNDYIWGDNFEGKSFVGFFEWMFKTICEDPNSLFAVIPKEPGKETTTTKVEPTIKHIASRDILYIAEDGIIFVEWMTPYAWYITDMGSFKFRNIHDGTSKKAKYELIDEDGYFAHLLTYKPAHFAGGIWNTHRYYDSYLKSAQAACDDFVAAHSAMQMINKEACHPFIQAVQTDCPACDGHKQVRQCTTCRHSDNNCTCDTGDNERFQLFDCHACNGKGYTQSRNPADWIITPKEMSDQDMVKIIPFEMGANEHLANTRNEALKDVRKALYQQHIEEAQSGTAKDIDRQAQMLYRSMVSNGVWNTIERVLIDVLSMRNTATENGERKPEIPKYTLVKPTDFDLKTEYDLLEEYKESTEAKMPDWVRQKQVEQYNDKVFGGDAYLCKKASMINQMDAYSVMSVTDKVALLSASGITKEDFQFSNNLPKILDQVKREKGAEWFVIASYEDIDIEVQRILKTINPLPEPTDKAKVEEIV